MSKTGEKLEAVFSAYSRGFSGRLKGQAATDNPFEGGTDDHRAWRKGWEDQDAHLNWRDDALDSIGWFGR